LIDSDKKMKHSSRDLSFLSIPLLRIGGSFLMMIHGFSKLETLLSDEKIEFYNFMGLGAEASLILAVIGELLAPLMILFGIQTRLAAAVAAGTMAVAAFGAHAGDPLEDREHSLLYLVVFLCIFFYGAGRWSIDEIVSKRRRK
jgi:putative oxidoreductase